MQKTQMSQEAISRTVAAHVKKTSMPSVAASAQRILSARVHMGGGGVISPCVGKHVTKSARVSFGGGGMVHPCVAKHTQK